MHPRLRSALTVPLLLVLAGVALAMPASAAKRIPSFAGGCNPSTTTPGVAVACYTWVDSQLPDDPAPTGTLKITAPSYKGTLSVTRCDAASFCDFGYLPKGAGSPTRKDTITVTYSGDTFWASRTLKIVVAVPAKLPTSFGASCDQQATTPGTALHCVAFVYTSSAAAPTPTGTLTFAVPSYKGSASPASCDVVTADGRCDFWYTPKGTGTTTRKDTITVSYSGDGFWASSRTAVVVQVHAP